MDHNVTKDTIRLSVLFWAALLSLDRVHGQEVTVSLQGKVIDAKGAAVSGASVKVWETSLSATTGADGAFDLKGTFQSGVVRRASVPGGGRLEYRRGRLHLIPSASRTLQATLVSPDGRSTRIPGAPGRGMAAIDLEARLADRSGTWFLRMEGAEGSRTFRLFRQGAGAPVLLMEGPSSSSQAARANGLGPAAGKIAADTVPLVLDVSAVGHHGKRFLQEKPVQSGLVLALLPAAATLKERLQDFIGPGNSFRIAFLRKENPSSRKHVLHYLDFSEMAGDTMPDHAFADSRGPETSPDATPFGANLPSWSPDGCTLAYEIGAESQTTPASRIYLQPLQGARVAGPGIPSTNPRWWTDGKDTSLVWCTSGREDAWKDTASRTFRQKVAGGALAGEPVLIAKGGFNGGLSPDGRYLATAFRHGMMMELVTGTGRLFHIYPGHPPAKDGSPTDSLQLCNPSISPDPRRPSRMLFLDFGVPPGEAAYPNLVRPQHYAQHQMILMGDYLSEAPGRIVDFIDSPPDELAKEKTWDDPEWSNHPAFAVATTRDPMGDKSIPSEPRPTQPDIYIIHLPTKASIKVVSGLHMTMPVLWIGSRP